MMFSLYHKLGTTYEFKGKEYKINLSFDNVLKLLDVLTMKKLSPKNKLIIGNKILFGKNSPLTKESLKNQDKIFNEVFYSFISKKENKTKQYDLQGNELPEYIEDKKRNYSLKHDAEYIYASFLQAYKIDLVEEQGRMDWRKFQALLSGLPDDTKFKQVVHIRTWKKPSKSDTEAKQMAKLQEVYRLPDED